VHSGNKILQKHIRVPFEPLAAAKPERPNCDICTQVRTRCGFLCSPRRNRSPAAHGPPRAG